ncbi:MAG: hypothetical protein A2161_00755 [Candidatus Schekmanbacteria bacterium RBG_13_48_7]|uniref:General secretion pathway GspH domain-containing protein n=1 Tax=Candidatus Schekmanbacteria bacterium RBG_13_48_7 TaxID=1817878 RepID=A0A1F7RU93_9BACT|nr:MAG: hypothetical protein A2161_00755 [Candidatus Schekmanbacteria bacterium RBG_13_48_7]
MTGRRNVQKFQGFTLVELLIVIMILGIMMTLGLIVWSRTAPMIRLDSVVQAIQNNLVFAQNGAIKTGNDWFVEFFLNENNYVIANDDGWLGTTTALDQFGNLRNRRSYYLGSPDYDFDLRNNQTLDDTNGNGAPDVGDFELERGPIYLGKEMFLMSVNNQSITRVTFDRNGAPSFQYFNGAPASGGGLIWVAAAQFMTISSTDPGQGTKDQQRFRKAVKIRPGTGMAVITENY